MEQYEFGEALRKLAMGLGLKTLEALTSQLDPDILLQQASESLEAEIRIALTEILQDLEGEPVQGLIDRLFAELDEDKIIQAISPILAAELATWFKTEETVFISNVLLNALDMDEMKELVAEKLVNRIQISGEQMAAIEEAEP